MLSSRAQRAIKLMLQMPDEEVAAEVGVTLETVARWRRSPEFREALAREEKNIRASAARIASDASLEAARNLHKLVADGKDGKLCLDTLKASGAFEPREDSDEDTLESVLRQVADEDGTDT